MPNPLIQAFLNQATSQGLRSTILRPLGWLISICIAGVLGAVRFQAPAWIVWLLGVSTGFGVLLYIASFIFCLLTPLSQLSQPPQSPALEPIAKIEYDRLIAYFDKLVRYSLLGIGFVITAAGIFLWKNTDDVKNQAAVAIKTTQDSATRAIFDIGKSAQETAKSEAQNAIDAAFEKQNIQKMIETTAQKKVEAAVDAEVQRKLGEKIESFRVLTTKIGQVSIHSAMLMQESRDGLDGLLKDRQDPDPTVRDYAASTLKQIGADYERRLMGRLQERQDYYLPFFPQLPTKDLMGRIQHFHGAQAAEEIAKAFLDMKRKVQWDVLVFDIPAAERWCAAHKPKCEE